MMVVIVATAILTVTSLVGWLAYLRFLHRLVKDTKSSASLRNAAIAAKAYRGAAPAAIAQAVTKLLKR